MSARNVNNTYQVNNTSTPKVIKRSQSPHDDEYHTKKKIKTKKDNDEIDAGNSSVSSMGGRQMNKADNVKNLNDTRHKQITVQTKQDKSSVYTKKRCVKDVSTNKSRISKKNTRIGVKNKLNSNSEICNICGLWAKKTDPVCYQGHPQNAVEEKAALTNDKLVKSPGDNTNTGMRSQIKITGFTIFDKHGHLCPLETFSVIEKEAEIYLAGYLKPIGSDSPVIDEEFIPVKDIGPILAWSIRRRLDGVKIFCITLSTEFADYNLQKASEQYKPLMDILYEKIWICKVVVKYLKKNFYLLPTYEEFIENIRRHSIPELNHMKMTEDMLHKHAHFLCDQLISMETDVDENPLSTQPCIRKLKELVKNKFIKSKTCTKIEQARKKVNKKAWTKATTTPVVRKTFESLFTSQLDKTDHESVSRRKRCGICKACQLPDCGECYACRAMAKFGGHSRAKKACVRRCCSNMGVKRTEQSDTDDFKQDEANDHVRVKVTNTYRKIKWIGQPIQTDARKVYYEKVELDDSELKHGDFVIVETFHSNVPSLIVKIVYMWKEIPSREAYFHGEVFMRSSDTVLGEVGEPREVFLCDRCCHGVPIAGIIRKACVERKNIPADWSNLGGKEVKENAVSDDDGKHYFYRKYYARFTGRFMDLPEDPTCPNILRKHRFCPSCERKTRREDRCIPKVKGELAETSPVVPANMTEWTAVRWQGYEYKKDCGVFLYPGTFRLRSSSKDTTSIQKTKRKTEASKKKMTFTNKKLYMKKKTSRKMIMKNQKKKNRGNTNKEKVNEDIYTEHYRKSDNYLRGSNVDTRQPFCVGYILAVVSKGWGSYPLIDPHDIRLIVKIMYRPENTEKEFPHREDLNMVYWSDEIREIPFATVTGPCHLIYERNVPEQDSLHEWLDRDPNRFYFRSAYNKTTGRIVKVPDHATTVGKIDTANYLETGNSKSAEAISSGSEAKVRPMRTLDVFAGCGGLSEGLHQAGVAECRWAVENSEPAARAYSLNNHKCAVFVDDCNALLRDVMDGAIYRDGRRLPMRGEVELLCAGPPCQGFSGMNRFNSRDYSEFKNSLIASTLSYCDYYRPKYFILENVRNFVAFKRGMVLKLTLRALLDMGYQCTFGVLQAGHYGVPQTRRRLIVLAAAPGCVLPLYPEPTHAFSLRACSLTVTVDGKRFATNVRWENSAPRRTCTVRDAVSDLPEISDGADSVRMEYGSKAESHFQRAARGIDDTAKLIDHICKRTAPLVQARMSHIPTAAGSDWRDLPNITCELSDGTKCEVLHYRYDDKRNGRSRTGALRGVCACASGQPCSPQDKQENTLIPWCLPHTGNRHNHWAGLYGRIDWEGYFSTTITDPEPMGKQGRVLHPVQPRVVSVRECARSQGFPDRYVFAGTIKDKYRQIGNAVPPPLGAALGREIKKAIIAKTTIQF